MSNLKSKRNFAHAKRNILVESYDHFAEPRDIAVLGQEAGHTWCRELVAGRGLFALSFHERHVRQDFFTLCGVLQQRLERTKSVN